MPGSHDRNTPEEVEGVLVRVLDMRPSTKIPWCARCDRLMYQFLAGLRLSPGATGPQLPQLARLMDCWFDPVRWPDFARVVWPKISASLEYKLKGLHDQHRIVNYIDPSGAWRTYWPEYTRAWALDNWDGSMAGTVDGVLRDNLIRHGTADRMPGRAAPVAAAPRQVFGEFETPGMSRVADWVDSTAPPSSQPSTYQPSTSQQDSPQPSTSQPSTSQPSSSQQTTSRPGTQHSGSRAGERSSAWSEGGSTLLSAGPGAVGPAGSGRQRGGRGRRRGRSRHPASATAAVSPAEMLAMMRAVLAQQDPAANGAGS